MHSSSPRYIGEIKDQLRHGFGVYNYPNSFFKYEGEWRKGKKHGHGKLVMSDGSFYEGQFVNGEMSGVGIRKWARSCNVYEGEFQRGELNGKGVMKYADGSTYEGDWVENMRQGEGKLTIHDGSLYKGSFYKHNKHGDGYETYGDGRVYEGGFICGSKQGHGIMKFSDGSIYEGQWRSDLFNGQGSFIHCSGASYEGIWVNGRPEVDATEIRIEGDEEVELEQGQPLIININCVTADGDVSEESGRVLQVTAGVRSVKTSTGTSSKASISMESTTEQQTEDPFIQTPFGFDIEPYLIIEDTTQQQQSENIMRSNSIGHDKVSSDKTSVLPPIADQSEELEMKIETSAETERSFEGTRVTFHETTEEIIISNPTNDQEDEVQGETSQDRPPGLMFRTVNGKVSPSNIILPPLSANSSGCTLRSTPDSEGRLSGNNRVKKSDSSTISAIEREKKKGKQESVEHEKTKDKDGKKKKEKKEEQKLNDDRYCKPGDYVLIVQDVTNPPFLDTTLKTAYLHVKITPKLKKSKGGTRNKSNVV